MIFRSVASITRSLTKMVARLEKHHENQVRKHVVFTNKADQALAESRAARNVDDKISELLN